MQALVKREAAPGLALEDVPEPRPGINDVLIKVGAAPSVVRTCTSTTGMTGHRRPSRYP